MTIPTSNRAECPAISTPQGRPPTSPAAEAGGRHGNPGRCFTVAAVLLLALAALGQPGESSAATAPPPVTEAGASAAAPSAAGSQLEAAGGHVGKPAPEGDQQLEAEEDVSSTGESDIIILDDESENPEGVKAEAPKRDERGVGSVEVIDGPGGSDSRGADSGQEGHAAPDGSTRTDRQERRSPDGSLGPAPADVIIFGAGGSDAADTRRSSGSGRSSSQGGGSGVLGGTITPGAASRSTGGGAASTGTTAGSTSSGAADGTASSGTASPATTGTTAGSSTSSTADGAASTGAAPPAATGTTAAGATTTAPTGGTTPAGTTSGATGTTPGAADAGTSTGATTGGTPASTVPAGGGTTAGTGASGTGGTPPAVTPTPSSPDIQPPAGARHPKAQRRGPGRLRAGRMMLEDILPPQVPPTRRQGDRQESATASTSGRGSRRGENATSAAARASEGGSSGTSGSSGSGGGSGSRGGTGSSGSTGGSVVSGSRGPSSSILVSVGDSASIRTTAFLQHLTSLKRVKVPSPPDLAKYVRDRQALQVLGKALFWDEQLGSDRQACASCHYHAGADSRSRNQLNPGFRNTTPGVDTNRFSTELGFGPNYQLKESDFPLHKLSNPEDRTSPVLSDTHNVVSSQGVFNAQFSATGVPEDLGQPSMTGPGAVFNLNGMALVRNVEPRNTPPSVNSALNHRNFWDGRARSEFNGANPIGLLDPTARIAHVPTGAAATLVAVQIENSSTASQAVGPPLSNLEMSFDGRQFAQLGRKMLAADLVPLAQQRVAPDDSLLGPYSRRPQPGLSIRYDELVRKAFKPEWWDAPGQVVDVSGSAPVIRQGAANPDRFTVAEYNFSLFFGLAIQEYERLLVSDDSPFDRFMEGKLDALTPRQQQGLVVFSGPGKCISCHGGPELTNAGISTFHRLDQLERMIVGNFQTVQDLNEGYPPDPVGFRIAVYDNGFYNIGVRPTAEDLGIGARIGPENLPLANSRRHLERIQAAIAAVQAENPTLDYDSVVLLTNQRLGVPRILARPGEAFNLLQRAALRLGYPSDVVILLSQAYAVLVASSDDAALRLAVIDAAMLDAECAGALGCTPMPLQLPQGVPVNLTGASDLLVQARDRMAAMVSRTAVANEVIQLLSSATMLLPDPVDPGPNPLRPYGPPIYPDEAVNDQGAFKTPSLRNIELTAPYFHNGGQLTLHQVVEHYDRGGDFGLENKDHLSSDIHPLLLTQTEIEALVDFLTALTDDRVRYERAPFDHPSLSVPNGGSGQVTMLHGVPVMDDRVEVPEVGAQGNGVGLGTPGTAFRNFLQP